MNSKLAILNIIITWIEHGFRASMHHKLPFIECYLNNDSSCPYNTRWELFAVYHNMQTIYSSENIQSVQHQDSIQRQSHAIQISNQSKTSTGRRHEQNTLFNILCSCGRKYKGKINCSLKNKIWKTQKIFSTYKHFQIWWTVLWPWCKKASFPCVANWWDTFPSVDGCE